MRRRTVDFRIVLDHDPVLNDCNSRGRYLFVAVKFRRGEKDVVGLPVSGGSTGVDERRGLSVNGSASPVGVIIDFKRIKNLNFVSAKKNESVIPLITPRAFEICRGKPFEVELERLELIFGFERPRRTLNNAVGKFPLSRFPCVCIRPVEKYDCVFRGFRKIGGRRRIDLLRNRPFGVMNEILAPRLFRRVSITVGLVFILWNNELVAGKRGAQKQRANGERKRCVEKKLFHDVTLSYKITSIDLKLEKKGVVTIERLFFNNDRRVRIVVSRRFHGEPSNPRRSRFDIRLPRGCRVLSGKNTVGYCPE